MIPGAPGVQMQAVPDDLISLENDKKEQEADIREEDYHR